MCKIELMIKERTNRFYKVEKKFSDNKRRNKSLDQRLLVLADLSQMSATNITCDLKSWTNVVFQKIAAKVRHITEIRMRLLASREIEIMSKDWNLAKIGYDIP